ncbi:MAG: 5'-methylthioadenosine/adenosylhomocysteine nucleosidase [Defluviitaleaceae bacterium]|nr:5'-methylthioadenosine/adenosylhomocysteine nucleosidase [Defluviitaleaceae bacterium]
MIGIIGAMEVEIRNILTKLTNTKARTIGGIDFTQGELGKSPVVVARCGIGKVNAAHCASIMITGFDVAGIINTGVAGGIAPHVEIGDVVISQDLVQHDVEATEFGYTTGQVPGMESPYFAACQNLVETAKKAGMAALAANPGKALHIGRIATGDQFIASPADKNQIYANHQDKVLCTEMEGAAIAQVCLLTNTPFVAIRAISDKADGTAHEDFPAFVEEASVISAKIVMDMVAD